MFTLSDVPPIEVVVNGTVPPKARVPEPSIDSSVNDPPVKVKVVPEETVTGESEMSVFVNEKDCVERRMLPGPMIEPPVIVDGFVPEMLIVLPC